MYDHSRGLPRLINTICENSLITSYARQLPGVTPAIVREVAEELRLDVVCSPEAKKEHGRRRDGCGACKESFSVIGMQQRTDL